MRLWLNLKRLKNKTKLSWQSLAVLGFIVVALSLGQLTRFSLRGVVFYPHDLLILVWLLLERKSLQAVIEKIFQWIKTNALVSFTLLWLILGMAVAFLTSKDILPWLYLVRLLTYVSFLLVVAVKTAKIPVVCTLMSVTVGLSMLAYGFAQYIFIPDTRFLFQFGWDEHYYRLLGTLLDPNYTGLLLLVTGWSVFSLKSRLHPYTLITLLVAICLGVALTFSRATYLALVASLLGVFFFEAWRTKKISVSSASSVGLVMVVLSLSIFFAPKPGGEGVDLLRTTSITARYSSTSQFLAVLKPWQWVLGAGFYTRPEEIHSATSHARVPDNLFALLIYSTGLVGTVTILWLVWKMLPKVLKLNTSTIGILLAAALHAQFNNSVLEPFMLLVIGLALIGASSTAIYVQKTNHST